MDKQGFRRPLAIVVESDARSGNFEESHRCKLPRSLSVRSDWPTSQSFCDYGYVGRVPRTGRDGDPIQHHSPQHFSSLADMSEYFVSERIERFGWELRLPISVKQYFDFR